MNTHHARSKQQRPRGGLPRLMIATCLLVVIATGCDQGSSSREGRAASPAAGRVTVTASAFRGFHSGMGLGSSDAEYVVVVNLLNTGSQPLLCDAIEAKFYSERGTALRQPTVSAQGPHLVLQPGKAETYEYATDGYTTDLMMRAQGGPLLFSIAIQKNGASIVGPLSAPLPPISGLPLDHERYSENKSGHPLQLR